jgi:hypothetical protein
MKMEIKTQEGTQHVASAGVGGAGLGLGIAGTALGLLNGGANNILGGLFGGCGCGNQTSALMAELAKEKSERYTDQVGTEVYKQFAKERNETQAQISALFAAIAQMDKTVSVNQAVTSEKLTCLSGKVNDIYDVFKLVMPNSSVCPGWGNVTITPATTTTTP